MLHPLITIAALASSAAAVCTGWQSTDRGASTASSFTTLYGIPVDNLVCPANATSECRFNTKTYHITARRDLTGSGLREYNDLPSDELDAIFTLAQEAYYEGQSWNGTSNGDFITREANVTSPDATSIILRVQPGKNSTLLYVPFYQFSSGVLSDCSNSSLNNLTVTAAAPYLVMNRNNQSVISGTWLAFADNITSGEANPDIPSAASVSAYGNVAFGVSVAVFAAASLML